ncbi:hypothetical protein VTN00DRAFT_351 [Thermoascus crustaceus]|uniref:uncharacterized protein n=1 Tax=Thermoascus crustaceus TaxID=5088 RepID=UPI0037434E05
MIWAAEKHEKILLAHNVVALVGDFASQFPKHPSSNTRKDTNPEKVINKWPQFVEALESGNITYEYVEIPWHEIPDSMRELFEIEDGPKHIPVDLAAYATLVPPAGRGTAEAFLKPLLELPIFHGRFSYKFSSALTLSRHRISHGK